VRIGQEIQYHLKDLVGISPQRGYGVGQVLVHGDAICL
jgi:hypothetical protein